MVRAQYLFLSCEISVIPKASHHRRLLVAKLWGVRSSVWISTVLGRVRASWALELTSGPPCQVSRPLCSRVLCVEIHKGPGVVFAPGWIRVKSAILLKSAALHSRAVPAVPVTMGHFPNTRAWVPGAGLLRWGVPCALGRELVSRRLTVQSPDFPGADSGELHCPGGRPSRKVLGSCQAPR